MGPEAPTPKANHTAALTTQNDTSIHTQGNYHPSASDMTSEVASNIHRINSSTMDIDILPNTIEDEHLDTTHNKNGSPSNATTESIRPIFTTTPMPPGHTPTSLLELVLQDKQLSFQVMIAGQPMTLILQDPAYLAQIIK
ncbi:hypothetical protein RDI58_026618 [Solanum bulbocastanum]|uniref:Uncharacterized protein n=1 Tax=Solanum bulbocastanum TaxID=147425 RepID=A0AAN8Y1L7_SOLBU